MKRKKLIVFLSLIALISFLFLTACEPDPYAGKPNELVPKYRIEKISENVIRIVALEQTKEIYYQLYENENGDSGTRTVSYTYTFGKALAQGLAKVYEHYDVEKIVYKEAMMQELIIIVREKNSR